MDWSKLPDLAAVTLLAFAFAPLDGEARVRRVRATAFGVVASLLLTLAVAALFQIPLGPFFRAVRQPFLIAFSTASSEAALPLSMENMELFGVPKHIVGFVIPTGYSFNLAGTTLYLSLASVFVAQAAGVAQTFGGQLILMLTLMLTSKGAAGVPRAAAPLPARTTATSWFGTSGRRSKAAAARSYSSEEEMAKGRQCAT